MKRLLLLSTAFTGLAASTTFAAPQPGPALDVPAAPPGVTVRVIRIGYGINPPGSNSNQPRDRVVFADEKTRVLYTSDKDTVPGKSSCNDECTKTWIPYAAKATDTPVGHWSLIARDDGSKQWAFHGKPMYTYAPEAVEKKFVYGGYQDSVERQRAVEEAKKQAAEREAAEAKKLAAVQPAAAGNNAQLQVRAGATGAKPKNGDVSPEAAAASLGRQGGEGRGHEVEGHSVVEILPKSWLSTPAGIDIQEVRTAPGYILTDAKGLPLYTFDGKVGDKGVDSEWKVFVAPQMSMSKVGDFAVITRDDGVLQWAYKGKPLYKFRADLDYGDSNGQYADKRFQMVYVLRYFVPDSVAIAKDRAYGGRLITKDGRTLFARESMNGGSDGALRNDRGKPGVGEKIGIGGCDDNCEKEWKPLLAADNAVPSGYWTLYDRKDGKKQWAYFGYALYAHANQDPKSTEIYDKAELFEPLKNDEARTATPLHWRVAPP